MQETLKELLQKIESLQDELKGRYEEMANKYGYELKKRRVRFSEAIRVRNKSFKISAWRYFLSKNIRHTLSIPFIYGMIIPTLILDICITLYQWTAFPLYRIPRVKRQDYIVYERRFLDYLNWFEKLNCLYCSYVNGVMAYSVEIGARTERYWCPIKAASKPKFSHGWYKDFADYGSPEEWKEKYGDEDTSFRDVYGEKCFVGK